MPVTRSTLRGLRIAHQVWTSNAEAHADMYSWCIHAKNNCIKYDDTIPQTSTVAFVFDLIRKLRSFLASKPKRQSKRLFTICPPPLSWRQDKGTKFNFNKRKLFAKDFYIFLYSEILSFKYPILLKKIHSPHPFLFHFLKRFITFRRIFSGKGHSASLYFPSD